MTLRVALGLGVIVFCALIASPQACNLQSKALTNQLQIPDVGGSTSWWYFNRALAYIDARCFSEARLSLDQADSSIAFEHSKTQEEREQKRYAHDGARQYISAVELFLQGKRSQAEEKLFELLGSNRTSDVYTRATLTLASFLAEEQDDKEWGRIEPFLKELSGRGFQYWQTDFLLHNHQIKMGQGHQAIAELLQQLAEDLPIQRKLALQILLAQAMFRTDHVLNARILTSSIEDEVGSKLLDPELRVRFLGLCADIWNALFQSGGGPYAEKRARIYGAAVIQAQSELQ